MLISDADLRLGLRTRTAVSELVREHYGLDKRFAGSFDDDGRTSASYPPEWTLTSLVIRILELGGHPPETHPDEEHQERREMVTKGERVKIRYPRTPTVHMSQWNGASVRVDKSC